MPNEAVKLACHAMATRFELLLHGGDEAALRAAGEEALALVQRLDAQLSLYRPRSDVGRINALAAESAVRVEADTFQLLLRARALHELSDGAFDITVGPLMRCWGFQGAHGMVPDEAELAESRACVGMHLLALDEAMQTVRFTRPGVSIDLGGIGKGYALEAAAARLQELGVPNALIHGGTSSVQGIGLAEDGSPWRVAIASPLAPGGAADALALVPLCDEALSVSAVAGKWFEADDVAYGHVIDPRAGRPVEGALLTAVVCRSGMDADALSTALLTLGVEGHHPVTRALPGLKALILARGETPHHYETWTRGIPLLDAPVMAAAHAAEVQGDD